MTETSIDLLARRHVIVAGSAGFLLAGCGSLLGPTAPPPQIYVLKPASGLVAGAPAVNWQLAVDRPYASQSLDTDRIALQRGETMDYFADAQWTDTTPRLVQSYLVEAFEDTRRIAAVSRASDGPAADYTLETEIRDFYAHYDSENGPPDVVVTIVAKLVGTAHSDVIATLTSHHEAKSAQNSVPGVVQAFDQALGETLDEIVGWALGLQIEGRSNASRGGSRPPQLHGQP